MVKMTGGEALAKSLEAEGVKYIFGSSGHGNYHFLDALYDTSINFILVRHEQSAAHMADGYARVTGFPGVCTASVGPGAANMIMPIACAFASSSPLVAITGGVITKWYGKGQLQETTRPETPTWQSYIMVTRPITKYAWSVIRGEQIPDIVRKAFTIALGGRPGPVHIEVPWDIQAEEVDLEIQDPKKFRYSSTRTGGDPNVINEAVQLLSKASYPVILAGQGAVLSNASIEVIELAEWLGSPVATTVPAKGVIPEDHPLSIGTVGWYGTPAAHEVIREYCDVMIAIGCRFSDETTCWWTEGMPFVKEIKLIQIDIEYSELGKNYPVEVGIIGDGKVVLRSIIDNLKKIINKRGLESPWAKKVLKIKKDIAPQFDFNTGPGVNPFRVVKELREVLPRDGIIFGDTGKHASYISFSPLFPAYMHRTVIIAGQEGWTPMGFAPTASIGAKIAKRDKPVVSLSGDGGFYMGCKEVITASENDLGVVWIIFNDQALGAIRVAQKEMFGERYIGSIFKKSADFVKFAESFGAKGERIERNEHIREVLNRAIKSNEPYVVEITIDRDAPFPPLAGEWYEPVKHIINPKPRSKRI
jgi:acetolactate synthase-1/2/3 large subunit